MPEKLQSASQAKDPLIHWPLLTADWRNILLVNYEISPEVLTPLLPPGITLDLWEGKAIASMVGLSFSKNRILGLIPAPFNTHYDQVNLRFYVHPNTGDAQIDASRGVVFVKQIIPSPWVSLLVRWVYADKALSLPVRHTFEMQDRKLRAEGLVEYTWRYKRRLNRLGGLALGEASVGEPGSLEEFITQRSRAYTRRGQKTINYQVKHPAWRIWQVAQPYLLCDIRGMYGAAFEPFLRARPHSAFLAEGSQAAMYAPTAIELPGSL